MSDFFGKVYVLVRQIPVGKVTSYGSIARMLEMPHAARTVGWALHSLPPNLDVPWHRVINKRGQISLRGDGDGGRLQRALLEQEGVEFDATGTVDWERFEWQGLSPDEVRELIRECARSETDASVSD